MCLPRDQEELDRENILEVRPRGVQQWIEVIEEPAAEEPAAAEPEDQGEPCNIGGWDEDEWDRLFAEELARQRENPEDNEDVHPGEPEILNYQEFQVESDDDEYYFSRYRVPTYDDTDEVIATTISAITQTLNEGRPIPIDVLEELEDIFNSYVNFKILPRDAYPRIVHLQYQCL
ncbi:uncharacterized protein LOC125762650 [Anopheles funestus]|uniref:uncharacterized protein LOC125762650 n=1 Tax=Anopheles funestus TaxID=62324 RepID=UPI0020C5F5E1|nr:uncharacterized protein LOC125762650 [Anopheles funestus]